MTTGTSLHLGRSARRLLLAALAGAAVLGTLDVVGRRLGLPALRGAAAMVGVLAVVACGLAAARAYERGEPLRRAWSLLALGSACFGCLWINDLLGLPPEALPPWLLPGLTLFANLFNVAGTALFATTWYRTGLPEPWSPARRASLTLALVLGSVAVVGPGAFHDLEVALRNGGYAWVDLLSDAADVAVFVLVAPLLRTARALAGGSLAWPFALMAAADLCWLLFDAGLALAPGPVAPLAVRLALSWLQALGVLLLAASARAHRLALEIGAPPAPDGR